MRTGGSPGRSSGGSRSASARKAPSGRPAPFTATPKRARTPERPLPPPPGASRPQVAESPSWLSVTVSCTAGTGRPARHRSTVCPECDSSTCSTVTPSPDSSLQAAVRSARPGKIAGRRAPGRRVQAAPIAAIRLRDMLVLRTAPVDRRADCKYRDLGRNEGVGITMNLQWWQLELKLTGTPNDCSMHKPYGMRQRRGN